MRYKVNLESEKMTERQVRDSIEKASQTARIISQKRGEGDKSHDSFRRDMVKNAERDRKDGKI
ncbi:MAG: hypothetical protein ACK528_08640 [Alphaproteobacteria bacterium]|jgi:hypothetical protein